MDRILIGLYLGRNIEKRSDMCIDTLRVIYITYTRNMYISLMHSNRRLYSACPKTSKLLGVVSCSKWKLSACEILFRLLNMSSSIDFLRLLISVRYVRRKPIEITCFTSYMPRKKNIIYRRIYIYI